MKKTIPLKKQLTFKTNIHEITSISLENTLHYIENKIEGEIIISGTYKITENSTKLEEFEFKIPTHIDIDKKYKDCIQIDIEDFYYEIINNNVLGINVEILIDNLVEKDETQNKEQTIINNEIEARCIEAEIENIPQKKESQEPTKEENKNPIFEQFKEDKEEYSTYHVYIVRQEDSIDTITSKYNITQEKLSEYNDIKEIKLGDKLIIPENYNAGN